MSFYSITQYIELASLCYAMMSNIEDYFRTLKVLMLKVEESAVYNEKLVLLFCQNNYIEKYFLSCADPQKQWMTPMYSQFVGMLEAKDRREFKHNANLIYAIEVFLEFAFRHSFRLQMCEIVNLLKLASEFIDHCDILYERSFTAAMKCWSSRLFLESAELNLSQRKRRKLSLDFFRNPQYYYFDKL